jgi:hypothetical protein
LNADRKLLVEMSRNALETIKSYDLPSNALMINREVARIRDGCLTVNDLEAPLLEGH